MAMNSRRVQMQDEFHIHVDCLKRSVENALALHGPKIEGAWSLFSVPLMDDSHWIKAVDMPTLENTNVIGNVLPDCRRRKELCLA